MSTATPKAAQCNNLESLTYQVTESLPERCIGIQIAHAKLSGKEVEYKTTCLLMRNTKPTGAESGKPDFYYGSNEETIGDSSDFFKAGIHQLFYKTEGILPELQPQVSLILRDPTTGENKILDPFRFNEMPKGETSFSIKIRPDGVLIVES